MSFLNRTTVEAWFSTAISEAAKQPVALATGLTAFTVAANLASLTLSINRYLSVFGEPALLGFGDVTRLLPTQAVLLAVCIFGLVVLLAIYAGAPILVRHLYAGSSDLPLAEAYAWPNDKNSSRAPAAIAYCAAYAPLHILSAYVALAYYAPDVVATRALWLGASFIGGLAVPTFLVATKRIAPLHGLRKDLVRTLTFSTLLSAFGAAWMILLLTISGFPPVDPASTPLDERLAYAALVVANLVAVHLLMTVVSNRPVAKVAAFVLIAIGALIWAPGDQMITFNALRFTGAGGGAITFYRDPTASDPEALKPACLILTTGEYRIVWLVSDANQCSRRAMLDAFQTLRAASPSERQAKLSVQRVLKTEVFVDALPRPERHL